MLESGKSFIPELRPEESTESSEGGLAMRLECTSESEKNEWVKAINNVVKGIKCKEKRQIKIWIL